MSDERVDFGFTDVLASEKSNAVRALFGRVAQRYDLMNDLMSGGLHRIWKAALIDQVRPRPRLRGIDVAGGTGDIARALARRFDDAAITVCDATPAMLARGRARGGESARRIAWVCGDAEALPFPDASADLYTIAFGLRNVSDRAAALAEARRVLRPGGQFLCLEFSHVSLPLLGALYDRYSFSVVPWLGARVAGDEDAYRYLVESVRRFPSAEALAGAITAHGLERVRAQPLSGGIAALHSAWRI